MQATRSRLAVCSAILFLLTASSAIVAAEKFDFVVLGDTSYDMPADEPLYRALIATINAAAPSFSIHIGDTKGRGACGEAFQLGQKAFFDSFEGAVVYTPGNNEWADCWKPTHGAGDPLAELALMRRIFWSEPLSLGAKPIPLRRQSDGEVFGEYAENARWQTGDVTFATLNAIGEHNNQWLREAALWREFVAREKANVAWIEAAFAAARASNDKAVVFALHSDMFLPETNLRNGPFRPLLDAIADGSRDFPGQVLVVHGHEHTFTIDRPLREWDSANSTMSLENVTRLETYGWPEMKAVRVTVDTSKPWVFGFEPLYDSASMSPSYLD